MMTYRHILMCVVDEMLHIKVLVNKMFHLAFLLNDMFHDVTFCSLQYFY